MTTANDIIKSAFSIAGVLSKAESPTADETQDALDTLNDLFESLSNDSLFAYARTTESFTLTGGDGEYTIGTGGDFNTTRPIDIISAYVRIGTTDYGVGIIADEDYASIVSKNTSSIPYFLNYSATYPLGTIKLYPVPPAGYTLYLLSEKPISTVTLTQELVLSPGWNRFLKNQMALEIAAEYGVEIPQLAVKNATEAMGLIKRGAAKVKSIDAYPIGRNNNVYTGYWD